MKNMLNPTYVLKYVLLLFLTVIISGCANVDVKNNETSDFKYGIKKLGKENLLNGTSRAVCYSGFRIGQHPDRGDGAVNPSYEETLEDLKILSKNSNFSLIRLYDSGENSQMVLKVIDENNINIKVMLGIWLKAELSNHEKCWWLTEPIPEAVLKENKEMNLKEVETGITLANKFSDIIVAVNVGNEALVEWNDHLMDVDTVISYVKNVQKEIEQPVTVADNFKWWAENGTSLSKAVDFISIHVYPLWEGQDIDTALSYSIENVKEVLSALPGKQIVITEAGWATVATEFGERASEEKQERYFNELMAWSKEMNITTFFFEAFDEPWKGETGNVMGAEKHWGIFTVDRKPKMVMEYLYPELK